MSVQYENSYSSMCKENGRSVNIHLFKWELSALSPIPVSPKQSGFLQNKVTTPKGETQQMEEWLE